MHLKTMFNPAHYLSMIPFDGRVLILCESPVCIWLLQLREKDKYALIKIWLQLPRLKFHLISKEPPYFQKCLPFRPCLVNTRFADKRRLFTMPSYVIRVSGNWEEQSIVCLDLETLFWWIVAAALWSFVRTHIGGDAFSYDSPVTKFCFYPLLHSGKGEGGRPSDIYSG